MKTHQTKILKIKVYCGFYAEIVMGPETKNSIRQLYTFDNLPVLRSMDTETVDLIYLDPPFNSGKQWENPIGEGNKRALASFKDTWELSDTHADEEYVLSLAYPETIPLINALDDINGGSWKAYLIYMGARLAEMRRILKPSGSIYYHCDPTMSHGVKLLMDSIFGGNNFRNEISWSYHRFSRQSGRQFAKMHDVILFYSKTPNNNYNFLFVEKRDSDPSIKKGFVVRRKDSKVLVYDWEKFNAAKATLNVENYKISDCTKLSVKMGTVWNIPFIHALAKERTGYPTQKPLTLLERIITASSNKGDLVLDPFCGCATTCLASERLERQWIGIDLAKEAANLVRERLQKDGEGKLEFAAYKVEHLDKLPKRTDLDGLRSDNAILKPRLYKLQGGKCLGCEKETRIELMDFDHIIAKSRGGQDIDENIQLLCGNCNSTKGDRGMLYLWRQILQRRTEEKMREYEANRRKQVKDRQQD